MEQNWIESLEPLMKQYDKRKHPLDYKSLYQLVVMVILSAQDSDKHINQLAPAFFEAYPTMNTLAKATTDDLYRDLSTVRNFGNKSGWLIKLAQIVGDDDNIPVTLTELTALPGIGRKSANVIIRESGSKAEGVIVDLHVVRVAPRIGLASGTQPEKIEKQIMGIVPQDRWNDIGMALSFLGREICRPTDPKCTACIMNKVCSFYNGTVNKSEHSTSDLTLF
jgi:endonuclease III